MTKTELIRRRQRVRKLTLSDAQIDVAQNPRPTIEEAPDEVLEQLASIPAVAALTVQARALCARDPALTPADARERVLATWRQK